MTLGPEAEKRRWPTERLGEIRHRRETDAPRDEERPLDLEVEAVPERAENVDSVSRSKRG